MTSWGLQVGPSTVVGPAEPVTVSVSCRLGPDARSTRHPVTFGPDWSVATPHDPQLERIAAALGGGASCLPMLESALPGLQLWWSRTHRQAPTPIRSPDLGGTWVTLDPPQSCCPKSGYPEACRAAGHAREARHIARVSGSDARHLATLTRAITAVTGTAAPQGGGDSELLQAAWECGMPATWVDQVRQAVADVLGAGTRVELGFLLALASSGSDPGWAARSCCALAQPASDVLEWLAWTMTDLDHQDGHARAAWLETGSRRADILTLSEAGYTSDHASTVARFWGLSVPGAAKLLSGWVANGYRPSVSQINELRAFGHAHPPPAPAPAAVLRIADGLRGRGNPEAVTGYALALARQGTVAAAIVELRGGPVPATAQPHRPGRTERATISGLAISDEGSGSGC